MKLLTFTRGAWLVCASTLLLALTASPAHAASSGAASAKHAARAGSSSGSSAGPSTAFEHTKLNLQPAGTAVHATSGSFGGSIIRTIVGLLLVIALIYGVTWFIRKTKGPGPRAGGDGLEQVASLPLGTNRSVALVRVGDELHLLGVAEHGITGIRVFSEDEAYELGLPFHSEDSDFAGGGAPIQRMIDALRRITVR